MRLQHASGLRRIVALLRPYANERRALGAGILAALAVVALQILRPWPLKWLVDALAGHGVPSWGPTALQSAVPLLAGLYLVLAAMGAAAEYAQVMLLSGFGNRVVFRFRRALFEHLVRQPLTYHESRDVGELLTRVTTDASRLRRGVTGLLLRGPRALTLVAMTLVVAFWVSPVPGLVLAAASAAALLAMRTGGRRIASASSKSRKKEGALSALIGRELAHVRELQIFGGAASAVLRSFAKRNDRSLHQEQKVRRLAAGLTVRVDLVIALGVAVALGIGAMQVAAGTLTAGDLVLFLSYSLGLRPPFADFGHQTARLGRTYACAERLGRIVTRAPAIADSPTASPAPPLTGGLHFENVSLKAPQRVRGARKWTLDGIECELPPNARVAVIGTSGAGKSTLLRLVPRLADPSAGRLTVAGHDIRGWTLQSLREQISVVFQDIALPGLSVAEIIALGKPNASKDDIQAAAAQARVHELVMRLPQGYDTVIRRGGSLLSGGERRRLAIACALIRDGAIWLLDEPTAGLDDATAREIVDVLLDATNGRTTLWVTHDSQLVRRLDWVVALDQGRMTFAGSPELHLAAAEANAEPASL